MRVGRQRGKKIRPQRTLPRIGWELPELVVRIRESLLEVGGRGSLVPKGRPGIIPGARKKAHPGFRPQPCQPPPEEGQVAKPLPILAQALNEQLLDTGANLICGLLPAC